MDVNKAVSAGKSNQSIGTKRVGILLVNDDLICKNIVEEMLQHCSYQVLQIGGVFDVLHAIWEAKDRLYLLLTNAQKLESHGDEILQHIHKKLNLRVKRMIPHDRMFESKGEPFSFAAYILNGLSEKDVENLWNFAFDKEKHKMLAAYREKNAQRASVSGAAGEANKASSSTSDAARFDQQRRHVEEVDERSEDSKEEQPTGKKKRVTWTNEMHERFLEALQQLGPEKQFPKKIVEIMNYPGLTRENVASHLQKFRNSTRQTGQSIFSLLPGRSTRKDFDKLSSSSLSASRLNYSAQTPLPRTSPYMSTAKESITPHQSHYLNTQKDLSFATTFERKTTTSTAPNFTKHSDQTRDMLISADKDTSSSNAHQPSINNFVGLRLSSDLKSIEHGPIDAKIDTETQASTPVTSANQFQNHPILNANTEMWLPVCDDQPENDLTIQNASTSPSVFAEDQGFYISPSESNFVNPMAFMEGISEQTFSPSPFLHFDDRTENDDADNNATLQGTEITSHQFGFEDFDDILF